MAMLSDFVMSFRHILKKSIDMRIKKLELKNFRGFEDLTIDFPEGKRTMRIKGTIIGTIHLYPIMKENEIANHF